MRALYAIQQHVALCGTECKALLVIAGLFVTGLAASQLRAEPMPYDEAFYATEGGAQPAGPALRPVALQIPGAAEPDSARAATEAPEPQQAAAPADPAPSDGDARPRMNLNAASARLLTQLPGIGPKKAEAVVAYRDEHGAFASVSDLQRVRGIGPKTVEKLAPLLFVEPPPSPVPGVAIASN